MLRSVLSSEEAKTLLKLQSGQYVGSQFPTMAQNQRVNFAVLRIFNGEILEWRAGFYCFDAEITDVEEALRACTAKPVDARTQTIEMTEHAQVKLGPVVIVNSPVSGRRSWSAPLSPRNARASLEMAHETVAQCSFDS